MKKVCFSENQLHLDKVQKLQQKINILEDKLEVVKEELKRKAEGKYSIPSMSFYLVKAYKSQSITHKVVLIIFYEI